MQAFSKRHEYGHFDLGHSIHRSKLLHMDDAEIVLAYNAELRGFANYYALAVDAKRALNKLEFLWRGSLFKTLANKHSTSLVKTARRFRVAPGRYAVSIGAGRELRNVAVWRLSDLNLRPSRWSSVDVPPRTDALRLSRTSLADRTLARKCANCGDTEGPFHVHHLNPVRTIEEGSTYRRLMTERSRKTRALCIRCHAALHRGTLGDNRTKWKEVESRMQ